MDFALKNKKLSFSMNFPSRGFGEIQKAANGGSQCPNWWEFRLKFLTLVPHLHEDAKWQELLAILEPYDSNFPAQFESYGTGGRRPPQLKPSA